ncbi:MAG: hypothetical protein AB1597_06020 [Chloroflexota bacterium]
MFLQTNPKKDNTGKTASAPGNQSRVTEVLGREFHTVENGLDPAEVTALLESLTGSSDAALKRLESFASLTRLSLTMDSAIEEARKTCAQIKEKAARETEAEKARVLEQAQHKARTIVEDTRRKCFSSIESCNKVLADASNKTREMIEQTRKGCACLIGDASLVLNGAATDIVEAAKRAQQMQEQALIKVKDLGDGKVQEVSRNLDSFATTLEGELNKALKSFDMEAPVEDKTSTGEKQSAAEKPSPQVEKSMPQGAVDRVTQSPVEELLRTLEAAPARLTAARPSDSPGIETGQKEDSISRLYEGETTIRIVRGTGFLWLTQLLGAIKRISGVEVASYGSNNDGTYNINLFLSRPLALASIICQIPGVARVNAMEKDKSPAGSSSSTQGVTKVKRNGLLEIIPRSDIENARPASSNSRTHITDAP